MMGLGVREACICMCLTLQVQSVMRLSAGEVPIPWIKGRNYWVLK